MAEYNLSRIKDANGDFWNIVAKEMEDQKTFTLTGNVTGSGTSTLASGVEISATIADNAVTTAKITDGNVTTAKVADSAITLDKIADSAKSGAVSDNDGKLATHAQVKSAIDTAISGQGSYRGKQTVATINTWTAANLNNGDRCIASDNGTVTLGNLPVRAGEDLIFYKSSDTAIWQSMDGEFKLKQNAKEDPTASGFALSFIDSLTQDENGEITATKKSLKLGTGLESTTDGIKVKLLSDGGLYASTESSAVGAIGINAGKGLDINTQNNRLDVQLGTGLQFNTDNEIEPNLSASHIPSLDASKITTGQFADARIASASTWNAKQDALPTTGTAATTYAINISGAAASATTASDYTSTGGIANALNGKQAVGDYKTKQTAKTDPTASGTALAVIDTISQNENGEITATKKTIQDASDSQKGVMKVGSGLSAASGTVSVTYGTASGTACAGNDSRLSDARTPLSHTHGNLTNDGKLTNTAETVTSGDSLPVIDSSANGKLVKSAIQFSAGTSKFLREDGTWGTPEGTTAPSTTVPKMDGTASVGTETLFARGDHIHPSDTSREPVFTVNYDSANNTLVFSKAFGIVTT